MGMKSYILLIAFVVLSFLGWTQNDRAWIRQGNSVYAEEDYNRAAEFYYRALDANRENSTAYFNLGNSQYKSGDMESARKNFMRAFEESTDREVKGKAWHNIGNTYLQEQKFQEAVNAYKNALLHNPSDEESRHNLAFAQNKLQQQQQNQNEQDNRKDDQKDGDNKSEDQGEQQQGDNEKQEGENQQDQEQNQQGESGDEKEQENGQQSENSDGDQGDKNQTPQTGEGVQGEGMSREEAERLLRAIENQERQVQGKVTEKKAKGSTSETERDW